LSNGRFGAFDVRETAYWSVFAGACGHVYGCNDVWQFYDHNRRPLNSSRMDWKKALTNPGASQLIFLRRLIESRPFMQRTPDRGFLIPAGPPEGANHPESCRGKAYAFVYLPTGYPVRINLRVLGFARTKAWWYDPRTGDASAVGEYEPSDAQAFEPPGISKTRAWLKTGRGCDWVLVLDDAAAGFAPPGHPDKETASAF